MLDVLEVRTGQFEISDQFSNEDRNRIKLLRTGARFGIPFTLLLLFLSFDVNPIFLRVIVILLCICLTAGLLYADYILKDKLPVELSGFILDFTPEKKVGMIRTRHWLYGSTTEYSEKEIRFNQAIGFLAKLDQDGDIWIEIIVDPDFPGSPIFKTYSMGCLAEFNHMMQEVLPNLDRWIYRKWDNTDWEPELKEELNEAIQNGRTPWQIRKYFDFKAQSWT